MSSPTTTNQSKISLKALMIHEYEVLLTYALKSGVSLPPNLNTDLEQVNIADYNSLLNAVSPSSPQSISYINEKVIGDHGGKWFEVPIFKKCLIITMIALFLLIGVSLSSMVNEENLAAGLLATSGKVLFVNLVFICSASLVGVMFFILKSLSQKVKSYTLLPVDVIELNVTIIIGVISGFVVSELFTFSLSSFSGDIEMSKMTFALLGGFSSDAIFSILQGIVLRIKTFLGPSHQSGAPV